MDDDALLRYSRHLLLEQIGIEGQERLSAACVVVVGAGGLGCPALAYLAAAGVGTLRVLDPDQVEAGNLQRQILHATQSIGQNKAASAARALLALNPLIRVEAHALRADAHSLPPFLQGASLVLDCSDNLATRQAVNAACVQAGLPLISGSASAFSGQLMVLDPRRPGGACYACLVPPGEGEDAPCAVTGIFAPLAGLVGVLQAGEAIKLLCAPELAQTNQMLAIDGPAPEFRRLQLRRRPACAVCGGTSTE